MENKYVIDKEYIFWAIGPGAKDEETLHVSLTHEETMNYGQKFASLNSVSYDNAEVEETDGIKNQLDEKIVDMYAHNLLESWEPDQDFSDDDDDDNEEPENKDLEDFYDDAWAILAEEYTGYMYGEEFKRDCVKYYCEHKS